MGSFFVKLSKTVDDGNYIPVDTDRFSSFSTSTFLSVQNLLNQK